MSDWLARCIHYDHTCTSNKSSSYVPTRLLDLGSSTSESLPKLIETAGSENFHSSGMHSKYATLSHCWGNSQPMTLVKTNHTQLKEGIALELLPKTFSDVIYITKRLCVRYLWIDSLCIFQDSPEDWIKESVKMRDVYSDGHFNIAATGATDGSGGLFLDRDPHKSSRTDVALRWDSLPERIYIVTEDESSRSRNFELLPLNRRA